MSESGDWDPGVWSGHDFGSAYARYDRHAGRSYAEAEAVARPKREYLEGRLVSAAEAIMVVPVDVTGSMDEWPKTIFSKLPYLELEAQEYLGKDLEIAWMATGDAYSDKYPLQARPFTKGTDLKKRMEELIIEGNGGNQATESYEVTALYLRDCVDIPNAVNPIVTQIGDEAPYDFVDKQQAKDILGITFQGRLSTVDLFQDILRKYSYYLIRKPYGSSSGNSMSDADKRIHEKWVKVIGEDRIAYLPEPGRVVDVIFGILAKETGRVAYFQEEIEGRQKPGQVKTVYKSLESIHRGATSSKRSGNSSLHRTSAGKKSRDLM